MAHVSKKPQRSCVACGKQDVKDLLYRLVRQSDGNLTFDPTGRLAGRGAYVCSQTCFERARKSHRFERALRMKITDQDYERIAGEFSCIGDAAIEM